MKLRFKLYFSSALTLLMLINLGQLNVSAYGLTSHSESNAVIDTIENFDDGEVELQSYPGEDVDPDMWSLDNTITYNNSPYSLKLYGNTWKLEVIDPISVDSGDVWQVSAYIEEVAEIQGFGITDSINTLLYSFAGTEQVNPEEWITVYQGAFPNNVWNDYQLPVADDWLAKFGYLPEVKGIVFINDRDYSSAGISYFDEIIDITNSLPIAPMVEISYSIGEIYKNAYGLRSVDVQFTSDVYDPDSEEHDYLWDFGDDSTSIEQNPFHTFIVEDDHDYTVLLVVTDETALQGRASCQISVDPGQTTFPIKINFVGDIMLARGIENIINLYGYETIFDPTFPILGGAADITAANLESPLTNQGVRHPTKPIVFRGSPENVAALSYAGIDAVTLANNHIIDYGLQGLQQTQSVLGEEEITYFGAGADSYEALLPAFYLKSGVNFALLGSSDRTGQYNNYQPYLNAGFNKPGFANLTESNIVQQINSVRNVADLIIFEMHSGSEYSVAPSDWFGRIILNEDPDADEDYSPDYRSPSESDIEIRHFAVDQGADAVICHHPHIIQGFEVYKGKLIAHSLGNFVFDLNYPETYPTVILNSKIDETGFYEYSVIPVYIDDYIPVRARGELGLYLLDDLAKRSKDLNTYLKIDRDKVNAEIILDTAMLNPRLIPASAELVLDEDNGNWISEPILVKREGSISSIDQIDPAGNWQYRLGKELIWFGNFEDEGCSLWEINHPDEFYDTTESFTGRRSLCQKRSSGLSALNTNLEDKIKLYSDTSGYTLHAYIKTENSHNAGVVIQFFESRFQSNPIGSEDLGEEISGTTGWSFYNKGFSLPGGTQFMNLRLRSESPESGTGYSWFDNVGLIEWTEWQEYNPSVNFSSPNDYYWLQLKINEEILNASLNYTEIKFTDVVTQLSEEVSFVPDKFVLYQNYPNPFNPLTVIGFSLPENVNNVELKIYDILGQKVTQLVKGTLKAGKYEYQWNAGDLSSGVYFYQLKAGNFIQTKKMILLR